MNLRPLFAFAALMSINLSTLAATVTLTPGPWELYYQSFRIASYDSESECANAAASFNVAATFTCRTTTTVTVGTAPAPSPTLTFGATPDTIARGQGSSLGWVSANATSCGASGGWSGPKTTFGAEVVSPTATTTYTLECSGAGGSTSASVTVTVVDPGGGGSSYSTSFNSNENPLSEGGAWIRGRSEGLLWNDPKTTGGQVVASVPLIVERYADNLAHLNPVTHPIAANQYAQATVFLDDGYTHPYHEVELLLRFEITPNNARGYEVLWSNAGAIAVVRWEGGLGQFTPLFESGVRADLLPRHGDVLRAEIIGSTIYVYRNGALLVTVNDGKWTTGQPGVGFWPVEGATPERYGWQDFSAGGL